MQVRRQIKERTRGTGGKEINIRKIERKVEKRWVELFKCDINEGRG
jgi:hypothetical protein